MKRPENILFALFAHRVGILTLDQLLSICKSLRHGKDIDIGMSLSKRGLIDDRQVEAVWNLVGIQIEVCGTAKKALLTVQAGELIYQAIWSALKPQQTSQEQRPKEGPTIRFD